MNLVKSSRQIFGVLGAGRYTTHIIVLLAAAELGRVRVYFDDVADDDAAITSLSLGWWFVCLGEGQ